MPLFMPCYRPGPARWEADYEAVNLADLPHRRLTKPAKVCGSTAAGL